MLPTREMMLDMLIPEIEVEEFFQPGVTVERMNEILSHNCYAQALREIAETMFGGDWSEQRV